MRLVITSLLCVCLFVSAFGIATGAETGAETRLDSLDGVLIGIAACGRIDEDVLISGDPIWAADDRSANGAAIARVQAGLTILGYDPGPIDSLKGARTSNAIGDYQLSYGLLVDDRASLELARHIERQIHRAKYVAETSPLTVQLYRCEPSCKGE